MNPSFEKQAGTALLAGAVLITLTMVLHPAGGSIERIQSISRMIIITHSLAIVSIPILLFGFWGLTRRLGQEDTLSVLAFMVMALGLVAVMMAAAVNGLAAPLFLSRYPAASAETIEAIRPVVRYSYALNQAMDYIFIGACCGALLLWSVALLRTSRFPGWMGYFGLLLGLAAIVSLLLGVVFTDLTGFRLFSAGFVSWVVVVGFRMRTRPWLSREEG